MDGSAWDEEHTTFLPVAGLRTAGGQEPVVSRAALRLHLTATVDGIGLGHPGFVPDEYLNAMPADTTITAAELCTAGIWQRAGSGYQVLDRELVGLAADGIREMDQDREFCRVTGGHEPSPDNPDLCRKCTAWRQTATDWPSA